MEKIYRIIIFILFLYPTILQAQDDNVPTQLSPNINSTNDCRRVAEYAVRGGTPPYTYIWTLEGNVVQIDENLSALDVSILSQAQSGTYTVNVFDSQGLTRPPAFFTFSESSNFILNIEINEDQECNGLTSGSITGEIRNGIAPFNITIFNDLNQIITQQQLIGRNINLNGYASGTYIIEVEDALGCVEVTEIEIEELDQLEFEEGPGLGAFPVTCDDNGSIAFNVRNNEGQISFRIRRTSGQLINNWTVAPNGEIRYDGLPVGDYILEIIDDFRLENCPETLPFSIVDESLLTYSFDPTRITCFGESDGSLRLDIERQFLGFSFPPNEVIVSITNSSGITVISNQPVPVGADSGVGIFDNLPAGNYTISITHGGANYPECIQEFPFEIEGPEEALTASITPGKVTCFGENNGTATMEITGGYGFYTYLWNDGATSRNRTNLSPGNYQVTVTDAGGCEVNLNVEIEGPPAPITADIVELNGLTCVGSNDGRAQISNIAGGYGDYTITWNINNQNTEIATDLPAGMVSVTVTDSGGCSETFYVNISVPPAPVVTVSEEMVSCFGGDDGNARIQISGTDTYTVTLAGQTLIGDEVYFTNLEAGSYTATIQYGTNCNITVPVVIETPPRIIINTSNSVINNISCFGENDGSISGITASGGTGILEVQWQKFDSNDFVDISGETSFDISDLEPGAYKIIVTDENGCFEESTFNIIEPAVLEVTSPIVTDVTCFGISNGSVSFVISGGSAPYSYSLNGGAFTTTSNGNIIINNLPANTGNEIEIRDASGCEVQSLTFDINSLPPILIEEIAINQETCFNISDGSIEISVSGGSENLRVEWYRAGDFSTILSTNETLPGVGSGQYTVRVLDNLHNFCFAQQTFTVNPVQEINLALSGSPVNILCFGEETGAINITASGGTGSLTYLWQGPNGFTSDQQNISGIPAGSYRVRVTDENGCSKEIVDVLISQPLSGIEVNVISKTSPTCFDAENGEIQVQVFGGNPAYNISWEKENLSGVFENFPGTGLSLTGISAGRYRISVQDNNGCNVQEIIELTAPDEISISLLALSNVTCFGRNDGFINIEVTGGTAPYFYQWDHGFINKNPTNLSAGTYGVTVTDARGCVARLDDLIISQPDPIAINLIENLAPTCDFEDGRIEVEFEGGDASFGNQWYRLPENTLIAENTEVVDNLRPGAYRIDYGNSATCQISRIIVVAGPLAKLDLIVSAQNPTCDNSNGIIAISAIGGTPGYSYFVELNGQFEELTTNIISNLDQGEYQIKVIDSSGCEVTKTVTISNPNPPIFDVGKIQDVSCFEGNDGAIDFDFAGNISEINYQWYKRELSGTNSPIDVSDLDNLFAGTYFVRFIYDNGCTLDSDDIVIEEPEEIIITSSVVQLICPDDLGSFALTISGGSAGKTISITSSNGYSNSLTDYITGTLNFDNLAPGIYNWKVEDVGCGESDGSFEIREITRPDFEFTKTDVTCFGENNGSFSIINQTVESGRTYSVFVNGANRGIQTNFNNLPNGIYAVQLVDNFGCESIPQIIEINQPARPLEIVNLMMADASCFEGEDGSVSFEITGGTAPYSYTLTSPNGFNVNASNISANEINTYNNLPAGNFVLEVLDANGNCQTISNFNIQEPAELILNVQTGTIACPDETTFIALSLTGGTNPYTYTWEYLDAGSNNWILLPETSNRIEDIPAGTYRYTATDANQCEVYSEEIEIENAAPIILDFDVDDILCFGGSTTVSLSAARPNSTNFTFFVNGNQIFGNSFVAIAGDYQVYAIDNVFGCISDEIVISVNQPASPLEIDIYESKNLSCFESSDGAISLAIKGGTAPYTISFEGATFTANEGEVVSFNNLLANINYSFLVEDDNGCILNIPPTILSQPFPLVVNSTFTPIQCFDGEGAISVQATGGRAPYTITWTYSEDGINEVELTQFNDQFNVSGLKAGSYTYNVTDAGGCPAISETIVLDQPSMVMLEAEALPVSCYQGNDGSVTFTPSGGPNSNYQIYFNGLLVNGNTVSGLSAGTYTAFAMNGSCISETITVVVDQPTEALQVSLTYPNQVLCFDDVSDLVLNVRGGNGDYQLNINGETIAIDTNGNLTVENLAPGIYELEVTDAKGCIWNEVITIQNVAELEIVENSLENVSCHDGSDGSISVNALGGTPDYTFTWLNANNQIIGNSNSINGLSPGFYTMIVRDENNCEVSREFEILNTTPVDINLENVVHVSCNGSQNGSFTVSAQGGSADYTLFVNNVSYPSLTATGLAAGNYTAFVEDSNGCRSPEIEVEITQPDLLVLDLTTTDISCFGINDGTASLNITGGTAPYTVRWSDGNTTLDRTNLIAGNYEVVVIDANGCLQRENIIINQATPINATGSILPVSCFGGNDGEITLNISGGSGNYDIVWKNVQSNQIIGNGISISGLSAGEYIAEITDDKGCEISRQFIINQPFEGLSSTSFISNIRCAGETNGRIDLIVSGGTAPYSYQWSSGENTRSISNKTGGTYEVEITDAKGCVLIESFEIEEPLPITITLEDLGNVTCKFGSDGFIQLNISGGTGNYRVQWSNGQVGERIENLTAGIYSVFVFDDNTCFASETFFVSEPTDELSAVAESSTELCSPDDVIEVFLNVNGGTAPYTYLWSNGATTQNLSDIQSGFYSVLVTDVNGCTVETDIQVDDAAPSLQLSLEGTTAICASGGLAEVTANVTGGTAPYTYSWSTGSTNPTLSSVVEGIYTLTVTDAAGCSIVEEIEIFPPLNLAVNLENIQGVSCFGNNDGMIEIAVSGGLAPFEITWSNGLRNQLRATNLAAGNYTVTISDASGCNTTATYNIREPEILTFQENVENVSCAGAEDGSITLNVQGGTAPYNYTWSNGFNGRSPRNLSPGMYSVIITDRNGCTTRGSFGISEPLPLAIQSDHSEELLCHGDATGFINLNISGGIQPYRIVWNDAPEIESLNRSNLPAGSYKVMVIDDNGCTIERDFEINEPDQLVVRLLTGFDVNCEDKILTGKAWLEIEGGSGQYEITWNNGSRNTMETDFFDDGEISVIVSDINSCAVEVAELVEMPLVFSESDFNYTIISVGVEGEILVNDPVRFNDRTLGNVIAWEWNFGDGNSSTEQNPIHTYTSTGNYKVTLRTFDIYGCISEKSIDITVAASYKIMIPNAFSPNGDGINDTFFPKMRGIEEFEFYVFNKWGELIYSNEENQNEGWDGTLRGRKSPNGNYVYKIVFVAEDGEKGSQTGVFTLIN
ncbi:gliding motility-associated C-terminal domain-containing protein [Belliella sp. DSM 107340]|uniref:Gliding motility-associated C-terminal domain-containing protein n=1 Tax=Belliella calami TaxID=2923436 RepID=A0ABS9UK53_9BACT|nr:gliding motility-associated C-terminal domain-containing protein [Belliella calami]MCH7397007.1 gliding motility-associated C-terminal domain-containing protein [Belliella calami]